MKVPPRLQTRLCGVTKFGVVYYCHERLLISVNRTNDARIPLHDINDAHIFFAVQSLRAFWFDHARESLIVTIAVTVNHSEACEGASSKIPLVLGKAVLVLFFDGRLRHQALRDLQLDTDVHG